MFLLLFVLWIVFNGRLTLEIALFGAALSGAVYAFCCAFLGYSLKNDLRALRLLPRVARYLGLLIREIVKSNVALIRIVYAGRGREIHPQLVTFHTPLKGSLKAILADSITVTPGTITVHCEEDSLTVHCLDRTFMEGIENTAFQRELLDVQREEERA